MFESETSLTVNSFNISCIFSSLYLKLNSFLLFSRLKRLIIKESIILLTPLRTIVIKIIPKIISIGVNKSALIVKNINPFLVEGKDITVENRKSTICNVPEILYGSFALDDGNYTLSALERDEIIKLLLEHKLDIDTIHHIATQERSFVINQLRYDEVKNEVLDILKLMEVNQ